MMCARMLSHESLRKQNRFSRASERFFERVIAVDGRWLSRVLNHPWLTLGVALSTRRLSCGFIPKGFFPIQDNGIIQGTLQAPQSVSFASMAERQRQVASIILKDPAVESLTSFVGVDGTNPALNSARLQINLKPLDERDDRVQTVISRLQQAVDGVPGVALNLQPTQDLTIDTTVSRTQYQFTLQANSLEALSTWVPPLSACRPSRSWPTSAATGRTKAWPPISRWIATAPAASVSQWPMSIMRCTTPSASG